MINIVTSDDDYTLMIRIAIQLHKYTILMSKANDYLILSQGIYGLLSLCYKKLKRILLQELLDINYIISSK